MSGFSLHGKWQQYCVNRKKSKKFRICTLNFEEHYDAFSDESLMYLLPGLFSVKSLLWIKYKNVIQEKQNFGYLLSTVLLSDTLLRN